jgi:hypothetical protein
MNQQQQIIAIAEACGWKNADHPDAMKLKQGWTMPEKWCMDPKGVLRFNHHRPDYLNDLNAMHEAEMVLILDCVWATYLDKLSVVVAEKSLVNATAAQRAEAFLRTIGKWEDDE